ncbi:tyrosine-type recombinase/integrase [Microbispora sp. NPDC046933]|uniref:tyrosine-type recombinase/integrase n=1 Tax=Microbispora sp. NPDC046933 TaxID=3155618 RepID=UPI0033F15F56
MKRQALVPVDEELHHLVGQQQHHVLQRWPDGPRWLFPRPSKNVDGQAPTSSSTHRLALYRWLERCDVRDEHGQSVHFTLHQWRHTLGTRMISRDVPQVVVRRILDHDLAEMTSNFAQLQDIAVRRHWEQAGKVNITGQAVTLGPDGPLAEAAWAKQRLGPVTQALPNGYCGLPVQKTCPARQHVLDLPDIHHDPGVPAPASRSPLADHPDHHRGRSPRTHACVAEMRGREFSESSVFVVSRWRSWSPPTRVSC